MLKQLSILKLGFATTIFWLFFALQSVYSDTPKTTENGPIAVFISIEGAIGPATKDYFVRSLEKATEINASLFIIKMNTPGGLDSSMRDIIKEILASPIPVVLT